MKRILRQFLVFLVLLMVVTIIWFPYDSYSKDIVKTVREHAAKMGIFVNIEQLTLGFPGKCKFSNVSGLVRTTTSPVPFTIDRGEAWLKWLSLLQLKGEVEGFLKAYEGTIDLGGSQDITGGPITIKLLGKQLDISKHQILKYHSLQGLVDFEIEGAIDDKDGSKYGYLVAKLRKGKIENWKILEASLAYQLGFPTGLIQLKTVDDIKLDTLIALEENKLKVQNFHFTSSIGNAVGQGSGSLTARGELMEGRVDLSLDLTPEGTAIFGPYLSLAAKQFTESPPSSWSIAVLYNRGMRPNVSVTPRK